MSPAFTGERVLAAILFEGTMDRSIEGVGSAEYLWNRKQVIAILKVDKGLADEADGVQLMKPMPELDALLAKARANGIFGTKMRSVIKVANAKGISEVVAQQFAVGRQILAGGLVPIIEPEVDINSPSKKRSRSVVEGCTTQRTRCATCRSACDVEAHFARRRQFLSRLGEAPERVAGCCIVGWLLA